MSDLRNPHFPTELLEGDAVGHDGRNVIDAYAYWETEAIAADLDEGRHDFAVVLENFAHDFNIGSAVRNCNAFLGAEVFILGRRGWDRRGAVGTHNYEHVTSVPDWKEMEIVLDEGPSRPSSSTTSTAPTLSPGSSGRRGRR